jgi:hypothetical protein
MKSESKPGRLNLQGKTREEKKAAIRARKDSALQSTMTKLQRKLASRPEKRARVTK